MRNAWNEVRGIWVGLLCAAIACNTEPSTPTGEAPPPSAADARTSKALPELALSYEAQTGEGAPVTERRIAAAQAALTEAPSSLAAHVALATAFVRRARETSQNSYRLYARDVIEHAGPLGEDPKLVELSTMLLLDEHRFARAAEQARVLLQADPNNATAHLLLGDALLELGDYDEASDAYQSAVDLHPDLRSYNRAAYMRWLYGDFDGALQLLDLALGAASAADPESSAWCFADLGTMYLTRGDERRALAAAERALALVPGYLPAKNVRANALARRGETSAAIEELEAIIAVRPSVDELLLLADLQRHAGQLEGAATSLQTAEALAEHDPRPLAHYLARRAEQPDRALSLARKEMEARHGILAWDTLALALLRKGAVDEAADAIERALETGLRDPNLWIHAGLIDAAAGRIDRGRERLEQALAIDPDVDPLLTAELRAMVADA